MEPHSSCASGPSAMLSTGQAGCGRYGAWPESPAWTRVAGSGLADMSERARLRAAETHSEEQESGFLWENIPLGEAYSSISVWYEWGSPPRPPVVPGAF